MSEYQKGNKVVVGIIEKIRRKFFDLFAGVGGIRLGDGDDD